MGSLASDQLICQYLSLSRTLATRNLNELKGRRTQEQKECETEREGRGG